MATKVTITQKKTSDLSLLDKATISEIIHMALSDHVSFRQILVVHGLSPDQVKQVVRKNLAPGSYRAWRKRVRQFSDQRATYK